MLAISDFAGFAKLRPLLTPIRALVRCVRRKKVDTSLPHRDGKKNPIFFPDSISKKCPYFQPCVSILMAKNSAV
jgi:hypothetical protein